MPDQESKLQQEPTREEELVRKHIKLLRSLGYAGAGVLQPNPDDDSGHVTLRQQLAGVYI